MLTSIDQLLNSSTITAKKAPNKSVIVAPAARTANPGQAIALNAAVQPKQAEKVTFQQKSTAGWTLIASKKTSKKGHAKTSWTPAATGSFKVRVKAPGSLLEFTSDRFTGQPQTPNCADRQTTHQAKAPIGKVPSWYVFPKVDWSSGSFDPSKAEFYETGGSPLLPKPTAANVAPALGTVNMKTLGQTGCGFQFKKKNVVSYMENPDCVQWGLWPYGTFSYPDAKAGSTWGTYPLKPASVKASAVSGQGKVKVNVNPDRASSNYKIVVQRKAGSDWSKVKSTRTKGAKDVVTLNFKAGTYRVNLPAQYGHQKYRSTKVQLVK